MDLHCGVGDAYISGNLLVQAPRRDMSQNDTLACGEQVEARALCDHHCLIFAAFTVFGEPDIHCIKEVLVSEWLREKLDGTGFHRPHAHWNISIPADEDNRGCDGCRSQILLKIQSTSPWQSHIENEASGAVGGFGFEEFSDGRKLFRAQPHGSHESAERSAKLQIIVDHDDASVCFCHRFGSRLKVRGKTHPIPS